MSCLLPSSKRVRSSKVVHREPSSGMPWIALVMQATPERVHPAPHDTLAPRMRKPLPWYVRAKGNSNWPQCSVYRGTCTVIEPVLGFTVPSVHAGSTAADGAGCTISSLKVRWMRNVPSATADAVPCWANTATGNSRHNNAGRLQRIWRAMGMRYIVIAGELRQ